MMSTSISTTRTFSLEILPLKRREIEDAIEILARNRPSRELPSSETRLRNSLFRLPAEIRNMVYNLCFGNGQKKLQLPLSSQRRDKRDNTFNILQACHEIHIEASSLLEQTARVYIPITGQSTLGLAIKQVNKSNFTSLSPESITTLQTLTNFRNVQFHLHTTIALKECTTKSEHVAFDREICSLISRLRQALLIFTTASPKVVQARQHMKRHAIVHLDHYFAIWKKRIDRHHRVYTLWHLLHIMARDTNTIWEIRYYENTAFDELSANGSQYRVRSWHELAALCRPYEHIGLKMEICGAELPEGESAYECTREITPACMF